MDTTSDKILRIAESYGFPKKWGAVAAVAEKLQISGAAVSGWKTNGVPDGVLAKVCRETGANFHYLDTGEGEMFATGSGQGEPINLAKLIEAWDFLGQVENLRREPFAEKQKLELLVFVYNVRARGEQLELDDLDRKIKETGAV